jgi:thiol-disulfide isomerase/thioredoxin
MATEHGLAPPWQTAGWLNCPAPLELAQLRGKVVLLHAFQMLCPGCVAHALPQAQRVAERFAAAPLAVVGLHTVFEHHAAMGETALRAFVHEWRIGYPIGVDAPGPGGDPLPRTMRAYAMQGTPTSVLIDAEGRLRGQTFGTRDDLQLGAEIALLLAEAGCHWLGR